MRGARWMSLAALGVAVVGPWGAGRAAAHGSLKGALLKVGEVPSMFTSTASKTYTVYVPFLKVTIQGPFGMASDACSPPSILVGKYREGMIQSFGHTAKRLASLRVCSYLYSSAALAQKAYLSETKAEKFNTHGFPAQLVPSKIGDQSTAYAGKTSEQLVFRSGNVVVNLWYTDFKGVQQKPATFLQLGPRLLARLG